MLCHSKDSRRVPNRREYPWSSVACGEATREREKGSSRILKQPGCGLPCRLVQLKSERNEERVRYVASPRFLRFFPIRLENGSGSSEPIVAFCTGMKESEKRKKRQNHEA